MRINKCIECIEYGFLGGVVLATSRAGVVTLMGLLHMRLQNPSLFSDKVALCTFELSASLMLFLDVGPQFQEARGLEPALLAVVPPVWVADSIV